MRRSLLSLAALCAACTLWPAAASATGPTAPAHQKVRVPRDLAAYVLPATGESHKVIIYLHGRCGDPLAGIDAFGEAASARATTISLQADVPCEKNPRQHHWGPNIPILERRIEAAIAAVAEQQGRELEPSGMTVIGYSEGALRAESLGKRYPDKFPRVILIGSPLHPTPEGFHPGQSVATMAGTLDMQGLMRQGTRLLEDAGVRVKYFPLPGARHGEYGPQGNAVLDEVFTWLGQPAP